MVRAVVAVALVVMAAVALVGGRRQRGAAGGGGDVGGGALQDLVQFAAIEPDAAALRAIIDLDPLALAHHEGDGAMGAGHGWGGQGTLPSNWCFDAGPGEGGGEVPGCWLWGR